MRYIKNTITLLLGIVCFALVNISLAHSVEIKNNNLTTLMFVPEHNALVGADKNEVIRFWAIRDGKLSHVIKYGKDELVDAMATSNNGNLMAVVISTLLTNGDVQYEVGCYSIENKRWLWRKKWDGILGPRNLRFERDDRSVTMQGFDKIVTYDSQKGNILRQLEDTKYFSSGYPRHKNAILALSPSAKYAAILQGRLEHNEFITRYPNVWVVVWDLERKQIVGRQGKMQSKYKNCSAVFTPDEKYVLLGSMDGTVREWSISEQKAVRERKWYGAGITLSSDDNDSAPFTIDSLIFSPDARYVAAMGADGKNGFRVKIYDYAKNELVMASGRVGSAISMCGPYPMAFSADSKYFAMEKDGDLCLYKTGIWKEQWCVKSVTKGK
jgi:WD40 repeat protein